MKSPEEYPKTQNRARWWIRSKNVKCRGRRGAVCVPKQRKWLISAIGASTLHFYDFGADEAKALDMHKKCVCVGR